MSKNKHSDNIKIFSVASRSKTQFLKDPIHNEINFEGDTLWMYQLLETPEFKRLKDIKQLGLSSIFFPGATHTRASHCLGAYEVMRQMLLNSSFKSISKTEKFTLLCAALLHDLGHGPHSHAFEDYFASSFTKEASHEKNFKHEYFSLQFVTNERGNIAPILLKNNVDPFKVASLIDAKNQLKKLPTWMTQLVSSELDVDRIDYLLRDSYYSGANYGSIDAQALIRWAHFDVKNKRVSYVKKAIPTIENFLVGRYHMYQAVYLNDKTSLLVSVLWFAFKRIKELYNQNAFDWDGYEYIRDVLRIMFQNKPMKNINLNDYLLMSDFSFESFLQTTYLKTKDKILKKILDCYFLNNKYLMFFFKEKNERNEHYKKLCNFTNSRYNVLKYDYPTKEFYAPNNYSAEITIYDDLSQKSTPITQDSELIKNGNKIFTMNQKHIYGILVHEDFLKFDSKLQKIFKA